MKVVEPFPEKLRWAPHSKGKEIIGWCILTQFPLTSLLQSPGGPASVPGGCHTPSWDNVWPDQLLAPSWHQLHCLPSQDWGGLCVHLQGSPQHGLPKLNSWVWEDSSPPALERRGEGITWPVFRFITKLLETHRYWLFLWCYTGPDGCGFEGTSDIIWGHIHPPNAHYQGRQRLCYIRENCGVVWPL